MRWIGCLLLLLGTWTCGASAADRPNVLFIIADDLNCDLGCYRDKNVYSPNIDEISRTGVRFNKAYVQYTVCNPSRTSFLTGIRPEHSGVLSNGEHFRKKLPDAVTLPQLFKKNGYSSFGLGKVFHRGLSPDDTRSEWDDPRSWDSTFYGKATATGNTGLSRNMTGGKLPWCTWRAAEGADVDQADGQLTAEAVKILGQKHTKPFFLAVGFYRPHDPFQTPKKYYDQYPLNRLTLPTMPDGYKLPNKYAIPGGATRQAFEAFTGQDKREFLRAYYAGVTFVDAQVGHLLDALDRNNLTRNTIVVFLGDHGYELGVRNWWNKATLFERSCRTPLIVRDPRAKGNGDLCKGQVEFVDIYPTLAERCNLKNVPVKQLEGVSFSRLLEDPTMPGKPTATTVVERGKILGRSVRTEIFRYTEWDGQFPELYEDAKDPGEWVNLASDPAYASTVAEMKKKLPK